VCHATPSTGHNIYSMGFEKPLRAAPNRESAGNRSLKRTRRFKAPQRLQEPAIHTLDPSSKHPQIAPEIQSSTNDYQTNIIYYTTNTQTMSGTSSNVLGPTKRERGQHRATIQ
jgi:hypothetical protein